MKHNNAELNCTGLKCDNPNCDWKDLTIGFEKYEEWINEPCPKCGENVLTREDYANAEMVRLMAGLLNSFSPEELKQMAEGIDMEEVKKHPLFANAKGLENLDGDSEEKVSITFETHKEIKVSDIKKIDEQ